MKNFIKVGRTSFNIEACKQMSLEEFTMTCKQLKFKGDVQATYKQIVKSTSVFEIKVDEFTRLKNAYKRSVGKYPPKSWGINRLLKWEKDQEAV